MYGIDGIIYINLDDRTDRRELIEQEFVRMKIPPEKIHRLSATLDRLNGVRGCLLSHMQALELAEEKRWNRFLIMEDDSLFVCGSDELNSSLECFFNSAKDNWDVLFLGGTFLEKKETSWKGISQIHFSYCSHAYIVQRSYIKSLKEVFLYGIEMTQNHLFLSQSFYYALDRVWLVLQKRDRWYGFEKQHVLQSIVGSDIDIINVPMKRVDEIIYIDRGHSENLRKEMEKFGVSLDDLHSAKSQYEAIEMARNLKRRKNLIIEDTASFSDDFSEMDLHLLHFFKWQARDWDLFLVESDQCEKTRSDHFFFQKVTRLFSPKFYIASDRFLETLSMHFKNGKGLDTLEIKPEMAVFCCP